MNEETDDILDYDGEISNDGESFAVLPDNDEVEFTVKAVERGRNKDGTKPQVKMKLDCRSIAGNGRATVYDYITMTRKSEWKLCELFRAIGLRQHGETLKMRWDIEGRTGRATVSLDEFVGRDGDKRQSNKIKHYLEPAGEADSAFA